jgi:hypothetical protein
MKYRAVEHSSNEDEATSVELRSMSRPLQSGETELYIIDAPTWEDAMAEHYRRQGFKPYVPGCEPEPCPACGTLYYPEGSGQCGKCGSIEVPSPTTEHVEGILADARMGLANRMEWDEYGHELIVALCEEILRLRAKS